MTDQPKPNQPTQPSPPAQGQPVPREAPSEADKKVSTPSASTNETKSAEAKPEPKQDVPVNSEPPKPTNVDGSSPQVMQPTSTDNKAPQTVPPAKPVNTETSAPPPTPPAQPATADKSASQAVPEAKPASTETSAPPPTPPAQPANADKSASQAVPEAKPASTETSAPPSTPSVQSVSSEGNKTQAASTDNSTSPTEKRDISEDPTVPAKPSLNAGTTRAVEPPSSPTLSTASGEQTADKDDTIPPQSSSTKVTQRFNELSPSGQTVAGTICPSCGHRNRPGTLICDNCGTNLVGGAKSSVGTRDLVSVKEAAASNEPLMDAAQLNAVESAGGSVFSEDMVLRIEIEGGATPMLVYPKQEIILGRRDPNTGTLPDVDMTAYSGYRMGVSRTHASIHLQDKQLYLSDRGSSNGTFLNGTRLVAHRPYSLKDGDEIRLGQMVLRIYFQSSKMRK